MLTDKYNLNDIKAAFRAVSWNPFPRYGEDAWKSVGPAIAGGYIEIAEKYLDYQWPPITAEMYLTLRKTGLLKPQWDRYRERRSGLGALALAECLEGGGRFMDQIVNGIISTCEETSWIQPLAMKPFGYDIPDASNHEVDLSSSETASLLAWILYLLGGELDKISLRIRARIRESVAERIILPYLGRDDCWWMGFTGERANNWNPWCNVNVIMCLLLTESEPVTVSRGLYKVFRSLDAYVDAYPADGCCDEGPMYWGAAGGGLFLCLEILREASGGAIDAFGNEKLRLIGQYITKTYIDGNYFVNYADGDAIVELDQVVYRFGKAVGDENMMRLGASAKPAKPAIYDWFKPYRYLKEIFRENPAPTAGYYPLQAWLWKTEVMTAREKENGPEGFFLSAKGGNNLESHNHNDIGNFVVYLNGKPLFIDIGTEEYSVKTFGPERYAIWYIRSDYHNCVQVSGIDQCAGGEFRADGTVCLQNDGLSAVSMELRNAYPAEAGILTWRREAALDRAGKEVRITDSFALDGTREVRRFLITPAKPEVTDGGIRLNAGGEEVFVSLPPGNPAGAATGRPDAAGPGCPNQSAYEIAVEEIPMTESRLRANWGETLYRIVIREEASAGERKMIIRRVVQ